MTIADTPAALKARQQLTWSAGDYSVVGSTLQIVGETLCRATDLGAGERVLDVAAGNGTAALGYRVPAHTHRAHHRPLRRLRHRHGR